MSSLTRRRHWNYIRLVLIMEENRLPGQTLRPESKPKQCRHKEIWRRANKRECSTAGIREVLKIRATCIEELNVEWHDVCLKDVAINTIIPGLNVIFLAAYEFRNMPFLSERVNKAYMLEKFTHRDLFEKCLSADLSLGIRGLWNYVHAPASQVL